MNKHFKDLTDIRMKYSLPYSLNNYRETDYLLTDYDNLTIRLLEENQKQKELISDQEICIKNTLQSLNEWKEYAERLEELIDKIKEMFSKENIYCKVVK